MADNRIGDLPKHRKALKEADAMIALGKIAKALARFLPKKARAALAEADPEKLTGIREDMKRLASLPDRFNDRFVERGWIAFEQMNAQVAQRAVAMAEEGKIDEAEQALVEHWTTDLIRFHITRLKRVEAFPARWRMAVDAEGLYGQGQYHACTLLVLAVMDGVVQETSARYLGINQNFSAEKTILEAWDSIAGHSTGLRRLKQLMLTSRKKTNPEPIAVPYRHGIVHGMDVNFNSKMVAAKAWAALFAVGEWAYLAQRGQLAEPEPEAPKSVLEEWREIGKTLKQTQDMKAAMKAFRPRTLWQEGGIPATGKPDDYGPGTPERALVAFLRWWQAGNFGNMATAITRIGSQEERPGDMRAWFENKTLLGFELTNVVDQSPARSEVSVRVHARSTRTEWTSDVNVVMIKKLVSGDAEELKTCPWTFSNYFDLTREPRKTQ